MPDDRHVLRAVALAQAGLVLGEDDIEDPMELVLDRPVAAHGLGRLLCRQRRGRDVIAGLEASAVGELRARLHANDRRGRRSSPGNRRAPVSQSISRMTATVGCSMRPWPLSQSMSVSFTSAAAKALSISARKVGYWP